MLKREITYETFDEEKVTEPFYFHLSKAELFELQLEYEGGLEGFIRRMGSSNDNKTMFSEFKRIVLLSHGQRTPDGKSFVKSDEIRQHFEHSPAFDALLMEFLEGTEEDMAEFIIGLLPRDMSAKAKEHGVVPLDPSTSQQVVKKLVEDGVLPPPNTKTEGNG